MSNACPCNDATLIEKADGYQAVPQLLRLLATGEPVDLDKLVDAAGQAGADLARLVRTQPGTEWDDNGRLVGFGLTTRPTDYRFLVGNKTFYTWCASDTLLFTILLGQDTIVESTCPATGQPIHLRLSPEGVKEVVPSEAVVSQRHGDDPVGDLRSDICDHGHFYASPSAAASWTAEHPDGQVLSVREVFAECRSTCEKLDWLPSGGARSASA